MNTKSRSIATAVALLFIAGGVVASANESAGVRQVRFGSLGINGRKGQSFCATAKNACAGQNSCKSQVWLKVSRKECWAEGGRVLPQKDRQLEYVSCASAKPDRTLPIRLISVGHDTCDDR
jgi:hypothetical protein